jgi:hypothetical protein
MFLGGMYYYNHCSDGCKNSISTGVVQDEMSKIMSNLSVKKEVKTLYQVMLKERIKTDSKDDRQSRVKVKKKQVDGLKLKIQKTQELFIEVQLGKEGYNQIIFRLKSQLAE